MKSNIISIRDDGFCLRLKVMLTALRLANKYNMGMKFMWNEKKGLYGSFHACSDVNEVFSKKFIEKSYLKKRPESGVVLNSKNFNKHKLENQSGLDFLLASEVELDGGAYNEEFNEIGFSEKMKNAIKLAESINVDNVYAMHLRGGDLVYGPLKIYSLIHNDKVMPISVAKEIISISDKKMIIFAQDETVKNELRSFDGTVISSDLSTGLHSREELLIFDLVLMSRCEKIYGGTSGVCQVASLLSGKEILSVYNKYTDSDICSLILKDEMYKNNQYDELMLSFLDIAVYYHSYDLCEKRAVLEKAVGRDSENYGSKLILFFTFFDVDDWLSAEAIAYEIISTFNNSTKLKSLFKIMQAFLSRQVVCEKIFSSEFDYRTRRYEYPYADAILIFASFFLGEKPNVENSEKLVYDESLASFFIAMKDFLKIE